MGNFGSSSPFANPPPAYSTVGTASTTGIGLNFVYPISKQMDGLSLINNPDATAAAAAIATFTCANGATYTGVFNGDIIHMCRDCCGDPNVNVTQMCKAHCTDPDD